jgi:hypothetical protein
MEQKLELVNVDVKIPRLTVTPERVTIKFPIGYSANDRENIINFSTRIVNEMQPVEKSWRGRFFTNDKIILSLDSNKEHKTFKI